MALIILPTEKIITKAVISNNADIGFATDPDGDRLSIVDNKGNAIGEENTLVLCANHYYDETSSKAPLVTNLSSTMSLDDIRPVLKVVNDLNDKHKVIFLFSRRTPEFIKKFNYLLEVEKLAD